MAVRGVSPHAEGITTTLRILALAGALTFALIGCSAAAPVSTDVIIPDVADVGDTGGDAAGENDGEATVLGADLTSSTAALLAKIYAEGRDAMPTVEFSTPRRCGSAGPRAPT